MSKAFTKEDDDAGFVLAPTARSNFPSGPFHLTATGARRLASLPRDEREKLRAEVLPPQVSPQRALLGVTVVVRTEDDEERRYRLVSAEERALLDDGCSIASPVGRVLLGARVGDSRTLRAPRGHEEIEIVALEGEIAPSTRMD